ncbi:N-6 DNA methylase [Pseudoalteromonas fuliginea]|uniref:N-6 DNA methylase n=1 Tax=Pseudoalteromonas fuliginea TaxID=1872678 RepID=UPI003171F4DB
MDNEDYAKAEGFQSESQRKKRLGQVFTGHRIAKFLAHLSQAEKALSIIDPMAGSGDMIAACLNMLEKKSIVNAIEIDSVASEAFSKRIPGVNVVQGNAFDKATLSKLDSQVYDLVITNPPYVRYQETVKEAGKNSIIDSSAQIRKKLLNVIESRKELDVESRNVFKLLTEEYSGLADLAVPSWLLSCLLCKESGRIAVVLPESWISRDYAGIIHYLLLRLFDIEYVVEDLNAAWFKNVQVKTSLLVAKRKKKIDSLKNCNGYTFKKISLPKETMSKEDLVGNIYPDSKNASADFVNQLTLNNVNSSFKNLSIIHKKIENEVARLYEKHGKSKWFLKLEEGKSPIISEKHQSTDVLEIIENYALNEHLTSLETLGVFIGQGLRTGANDFFYVSKIKSDKDNIIVKTSKRLGEQVLTIPRRYLKKVLKNQSELPDTLTIKDSELNNFLIYIQTAVLNTELTTTELDLAKFYSILPKELEDLVIYTESTNFGKADESKSIVELTAVKPNIREYNIRKNTPPRFWYMLPALTKRHLPDLLIPRVNNNSPCSYLCESNEIVVDANFSTIRIDDKCSLNRYSLFALLNSNWVKAYFEMNASIMGGGALKLEAAHIKKTPMPLFSEGELLSLTTIGKQLSNKICESALEHVDRIILKNLQKQSFSEKGVAQLKKIVSNRRIARKRK